MPDRVRIKVQDHEMDPPPDTEHEVVAVERDVTLIVWRGSKRWPMLTEHVEAVAS